MIDWLTMRLPFSRLPESIRQNLTRYAGRLTCCNPHGEILWQKVHFDFDELRSDSQGLFWQVQGAPDGEMMMVIGASPAALEHGCNIFGSSDIRHCAEVLIRAASLSLKTPLANVEQWQCRRIDVTENYLLGSYAEVKQALRHLLSADAARAKASSVRGDTVMWNAGSDLQSGKAYHKGPQLLKLMNKGRVSLTFEQLEAANKVLRLELKLGARWFRRRGERWLDLTPEQLFDLHQSYFSRFFGSVEVSDMGKLLEELEAVAPSHGQALAAHRTWALIRTVGYEQAKEGMPRATWFRHLKLLREAGISDADLCAGNILPFRQKTIVFDQPVRTWDELMRKAA